MRAVSLQICAIAGIVVLVNKIWSDNAIETSLVNAALVALAIYVGFVVIDLSRRWVFSSPLLQARDEQGQNANEDSGEGKAKKTQNRKSESIA